MSRLYGEQHRALQERFHTSKLADRVEELVVQSEVTGDNKAFKVIDPKTVVFPSFDGNGMFLSMGNIADHAQIGMFAGWKRIDLMQAAWIAGGLPWLFIRGCPDLPYEQRLPHFPARTVRDAGATLLQ